MRGGMIFGALPEFRRAAGLAMLVGAKENPFHLLCACVLAEAPGPWLCCLELTFGIPEDKLDRRELL